MSNRFHNKYHRENHHSTRTARNNMIVDATYDPIASYEQPFQGEFFSEGEVVTTQYLSAGGFVYAQDGLIYNDLEVKNDLLVRGDFQVLGNTSQLDTKVYATSAVSITNMGSGPALIVNQTGNQIVANFLDDGTSALMIDGRNATGGYIGINTTQPTHRLTVNGDIKSTNIIYATKTGNSVLWGSTYTTTAATSARWESVYNFVNETSAFNVVAPTGQLTQNYVPKATGTTTAIEDSQIFDNGTSVAIGTTNTTSNNKLIVNGNVQIGLDAADVTTSGSQLLFGPSFDNTDTFSMYRYNRAADQSDLRVQVGDNNAGDDSFRIGATPAGAWTDWAVFTSEGLKLNNVLYTGEIYSPNAVTGEITASNDFLKVKINGVTRYIRLFDVVN
jgi:hypothetical protein